MTFITRFAPSPTGPLHLGHAYSALLASDMAASQNGAFLLRLEDIDKSRARKKWEEEILSDLRWLGLKWPEPVLRQSSRSTAYFGALEKLWNLGLLYPCSCKRRDIEAAISAPQEGAQPIFGPDGAIYPKTCRPKTPPTGTMPIDQVLRLDMARAFASFGGETIEFTETGHGPNGENGQIAITSMQAHATIGDIVLSRRDMGTSYHLSVVLDDDAQNITHVVRGQDLFEATKIHAILQKILGLGSPTYHHHRLIRDENGKRLAKRDDARAISKYRDDAITPAGIREMVGLPLI